MAPSVAARREGAAPCVRTIRGGPYLEPDANVSFVDFAWSPEDVQFKTELEAFLDKEMPPFIDQWSDQEQDDLEPSRGVMGVMDKRKAWQNKLNEDRWAAILWPEEWGGRAATTAQSVIYTQVMAKYRSPGIFNANGIVQIGPSIIAWGTEDQKARWLPGILDATEHWCQGFSEPQAGSDLANLRTTAILSDDGSHYVVNGQKIWISSAQIAKWGLFLLRTDPTAIARGRKHEGITTFIVDMELPGIEMRPIREITGDSLFCEVFFTDVKIPVGDRLGDEGNGWLVSMGALGQERVGSAGQAISMAQDLRTLLQTAKAENPDALRDPAIRERVAQAAHPDRVRPGC